MNVLKLFFLNLFCECSVCMFLFLLEEVTVLRAETVDHILRVGYSQYHSPVLSAHKPLFN